MEKGGDNTFYRRIYRFNSYFNRGGRTRADELLHTGVDKTQVCSA